MAVEEFVYAHRGTGPLKLRVFRPTGPARLATAVLHLHGGAWRVGSPAMLDSRSAALAARGYTVIQVQYRLLGHAPGQRRSPMSGRHCDGSLVTRANWGCGRIHLCCGDIAPVDTSR